MGNELENRVCNSKNRSVLLREDCWKGDYSSIYQKHDGKCLLAVLGTPAAAATAVGAGPKCCGSSKGQQQSAPAAEAPALTEVLEPFYCVWIPEALTAGALLPLSCVAGTHSACDPIWWDSGGAKHFLRKEFGFAYVSDVNCGLLSSKLVQLSTFLDIAKNWSV